MNTDVMFSSATGKWDTPQCLIDDLKTVFDFDLDVCASRPNVCDDFYSEVDNALELKWEGSAFWMNPPYGRGINEWIFKAAWEVEFYKPLRRYVVCLVPARTDTRWWQSNIKHASHVVFIKGRLKFGEATNSAPFPSAFVVFGEISEQQRGKLFSYGWGISQ